jgi:hypothetical protein
MPLPIELPTKAASSGEIAKSAQATRRKRRVRRIWFTFNDTWPGEWAYTDDFYIDYIDGQYYLVDLTHPGVQLLLVVE